MSAVIPVRKDRPVIFLASRYTTGGATLNARMLAEQFVARGISAELWCLYRSADLETTDVPVRVMLDHVPRSPLALGRMVRRFYAAVQGADPVAVVGFHPLANVMGALAATPHRRFIATQRNTSHSQSTILRHIEALLGATSRYHANIAVSHAVRQTYAHYSTAYLDKLTVIPNGLPPLAKLEEGKREARAALGLPQDGPLVGNIGRLHPQKAPEFLLEVASRIPEVTFVLAGAGPMAAEMENAVRARGLNLILPGRLEGQNVTRLLRSLDLFLFPSRYEGFGRTLLEAMSQGVPVIAHDLPVTREVLDRHGDFLPLDADRWAACIRNRIAEGCDAAKTERLVTHANSFALAPMVDRYAAMIFSAPTTERVSRPVPASDDRHNLKAAY
ncbi:glycosyltransferase family 4 protein [Novosphingobium aquimarinum]|uniref:glycosyltransferase family 4 protein n=1 Tax=Novosphingobium aquimarinum TaxID=2682494 RepID=UPI0012EBC50E|nr:glycosyltransferase family 4 protein [Novosphingobium aquimarinum]